MEETVFGEDDFDDPLRASGEVMEVSTYDVHHGASSSEETPADDVTLLTVKKEWSSFKKLMMQRFPASKTVLISMVGGRCACICQNLGSGNISKMGKFDHGKLAFRMKYFILHLYYLVFRVISALIHEIIHNLFKKSVLWNMP